MKKSTGLMVIILSGLGLLLMHLLANDQQIQLQKLNRAAFLSELQDTQAVIKISLKPEIVAAEKAAEILMANSPIEAPQLPQLRDKLLRAFGSDIKLLVMDRKSSDSACNGFDANTKNKWQRALHYFFQLQAGGERGDEKELSAVAQKSIGATFSFLYLPNYLNIFTGQFDEKTGLIIIGHIINPKMLKKSQSRRSRTAAGEIFTDNFWGSILLFIPEKIYNDPSWLTASQKPPTTGKNSNDETFIGDSQQLLNYLKSFNDDAMAAKLSRNITSTKTGATIENNYGYSFCQINVKSPHQQKLYFILRRTAPQLQFKEGNRVIAMAALLIFLLLATSGINNLYGQRFFCLKLNRHFILLAVTACSIPLLTLGFQALSQYRSGNMQIDTRVFNELETKLTGLEKEAQNKISDLMMAIQAFQEICENSKTYSLSLLQEIAEKMDLKELNLMQIYNVDRRGKVDVCDLGESDPGRADATRILQVLLRFIQQSIKFGAIDNSLSVKDGVMVESITEALGSDNMYQLALQQNRLLTFRMLQGAIWTLTTSQIGPDGLPARLFFYIFHRTGIHDRMIDKWQLLHNDGVPEFLFANQNVSFLEKVAPVWLESKPQLVAMLRELNNSGGFIRTIIHSAGEDYYCLGRKLKDIDWACMAVKLKDSSNTVEYEPAKFIFLTIVFLMAMLAAAGRYFAEIFISPLNHLTESVEAMAAGNYDLRIQAMTTDEIGIMCQSFNSMAESLKEKEFLGRFLSEIARDAIGGKVSTQATRVEGTVLFSDIRDFTTLSEQRPPEEIVTMLNDYMTRMETIVEQNGGTIEKFIGDAIMAVFLPALGQKSTAIRAAKAAEEMLVELQFMNESRATNNLFTIKIGVGVTTGILLMGTVGNRDGRREFTVTGTTVLLAAEMEKLTRQLTGKKIVLCPYSAELVLSFGMKTVKLKNADAYQLR